LFLTLEWHYCRNNWDWVDADLANDFRVIHCCTV